MSSLEQLCVDCPICLELLPSNTKNRVVTECGHVFHTSCLMTNVMHNGFVCPYCRALLANSVAVTLSEDDDGSDYDPDDLNDGMFLDVENVTHTDYVLRGLRWFVGRVSGDELDDEEDVVPDLDLNVDVGSGSYGEDMFSSDSQAVPPVYYIRTKLLSQGITMDDLLKVLMYRTSDRSFGDADEDYERLSRSVHGRMCGIISSYEVSSSAPVLSISDLD